MEVVFHPQALDEYNAAAHHYKVIQSELGQRFHDTVEAAIDNVSEQPLRCAILNRDVRRCLLDNLPYAVLYTIESDHVLIVAVMPCHRKPGYWRHRMVSES